MRNIIYILILFVSLKASAQTTDTVTFKISGLSSATTSATPSLVVSSAVSFTLDYSTDYIFSGSTSTWTLPAIVGSKIGRLSMITIKNRGTGNITINSNSGSTIYDNSIVSSFIVYPGEAFILMPDGTYFNIE